jgi:hypothetical protein
MMQALAPSQDPGIKNYKLICATSKKFSFVLILQPGGRIKTALYLLNLTLQNISDKL